MSGSTLGKEELKNAWSECVNSPTPSCTVMLTLCLRLSVAGLHDRVVECCPHNGKVGALRSLLLCVCGPPRSTTTKANLVVNPSGSGLALVDELDRQLRVEGYHAHAEPLSSGGRHLSHQGRSVNSWLLKVLEMQTPVYT